MLLLSLSLSSLQTSSCRGRRGTPFISVFAAIIVVLSAALVEGLEYLERTPCEGDCILRYDFDERNGATAHDTGSGDPFNFDLTNALGNGTASWANSTLGLEFDLTASPLSGPLASDEAGAFKVFNATQLGPSGTDFLFNYTMEAWVRRDCCWPAPNTGQSIFRFGVGVYQTTDEYQPAFLDLSIMSDDSNDPRFVSTSMQGAFYPVPSYPTLVYKFLGGKSEIVNEPLRSAFQDDTSTLYHVAVVYETIVTADPTTLYLSDTVGESQTHFYLNGVLFSTTPEPSTTAGLPLNGYGGEGTPGDFGDLHSWNLVSEAARVATLGYGFEDYGVPFGGWKGVYHQVAMWNRTLSSSEVAANYAAGPPSIAPLASNVSLTFQEGAGASLVFAASDGDVSLGWDTTLCPQVLAVSPPAAAVAATFYTSSSMATTVPLGSLPSSLTCAGYGSISGGALWMNVVGYNGPVLVEYSVVDERGIVSEPAYAAVNVTADQNLPIPTSPAPYTMYAGTSLLTRCTGTDVDTEDRLLVRITALPFFGTLYTINPTTVVVFQDPLLPPNSTASGVTLSYSTFSDLDTELSGLVSINTFFTFQVADLRSPTAWSLTEGTVAITIVNNVHSLNASATVLEDSLGSLLTLNGLDYSGETTLTFEIVQLPSHGVLTTTVGAAIAVGSVVTQDVRYTPTPNFYGIDTFEYKSVGFTTAVRSVNTATLTVNVTSVIDYPTVVPALVTLPEHLNSTLVDLEASDVFSSTITYTLLTLPLQGKVYQWNATDASRGVQVLSTPTVVSDPSGIFVYVADPVPSDVISYSAPFEWSATTFEATAQSLINITVTNDLVATNVALSVDEDDSVSVVLPVSDASGGTVVVSIVSPPIHGNASLVSVQPSGANPTLEYSPDEHFVGSDSLVFEVARPTDGDFLRRTVYVTVASVEDAPVLFVPTSTYVVEDHVILTLSGLRVFDVDSPTVTVIVTPSIGLVAGPDGLFAPSLTLADVPASGNGSASALLLDPLSYQSDPAQVLVANVTVFVTVEAVDSSASSTVLVLQVTVVPGPGDTTSSPDDIIETPANVVDYALVGAVSGSVVAACLLALLLTFCLVGRKPVPKFPPPPDFAPFIFGPNPDPARLGLVPTEALVDLEHLLLDDNMGLVLALFEVAKVEKADALARSLVYIFESHGDTNRLLKASFAREVRVASDASDLFRSNCLSSKLLKVYSTMIGSEYLYYTIGPELFELSLEGKSLEVDPNALPSTSSRGAGAAGDGGESGLGPGSGVDVDATTNTWALLKAAQKFFRALTDSANPRLEHGLPYEFYDICSHLTATVNERFPNAAHAVVGGFFFLRFVCHAITDPVQFGLCPSVSPATQRLLILVAKTLQNLSTGSEFKETYMDNANAFIRTNAENIHLFFDTISVVPASLRPSRKVDVPSAHRLDALVEVYNQVMREYSEIRGILEGHPSAENMELVARVSKIKNLNSGNI